MDANDETPKVDTRHALGLWWVRHARIMVPVAAYWLPDACEIIELRGQTVTTIATTSVESDPEMIVSWSQDCPYSDRKKAGLVRQLNRLHRNLVEYRQCEG